MFKGNNKNTRRRSGVLIVNFDYFTPFPSLSIVDFEQVNINWVVALNSPRM